MTNNTPYPIFHSTNPAKNGYALAAVGACRIYPHLAAPDLYKDIVQKCLDQGAIDSKLSFEAKATRKKYMKQAVAMAYSLLTEHVCLDPSIIDVEVFLPHPSEVIDSDGTLASTFLDAGATRIILCGLALEAMNITMLPRNRLVAHFDKPFASAYSVSGEFDVSFQSAKEALLHATEFAEFISVNFGEGSDDQYRPDDLSSSHKEVVARSKSNSTSVNVQDVQDVVQMLTNVQDSVQLVVQFAPSDTMIPQEEQGINTTANEVDPCDMEKLVIENFTSTISSIMSSTAASHVRIALVDPTPEELGMAYAACVKTDRTDGLYTTVVCNRNNEALGLVYSSKTSIAASLECGRGVYYSRSRRGLWRKGDTSGHYQILHRIDVDCDGDALRFTVTQKGEDVKAFCHLNTLTCWGAPYGLRHLEETLVQRLRDAPEGSYTNRLFDDDELLRNKLVEEAQELSEADSKKHVAEELADLLYFAMVKAVKADVSIDDAVAELDRRAKKVTRRQGDAKAERIAKGNDILNKAKGISSNG